jgi:membrane-bound lytic murein transglycosylase D
MNYYRDHNLKPAPVAFPFTSDTIMVNQELHMAQVSEVLGIPLQLLRDMNPQYLTDVIPAREKPLVLRLPFEQTSRFIDLEKQIYTFKDSIYFNPDKISTNPTSHDSRVAYEAPPGNFEKLTYTKRRNNMVYSCGKPLRISISLLETISETIPYDQDSALPFNVPKEQRGKYRMSMNYPLPETSQGG